ncbi:DNA polymerase III subunit gamma and tau [Saccharopolyspora karakumensis]|uniref:DNA polymerase III subunit gamma/tau n=1 Tax=Saccharopolyspora karakumensis TaxID=2530386 RepID=A0A4R5C0S2_9PSEU|nr:DNA polymerase III subunit gamma and tau [Saccharopolyspora karakumensis]TDD90282.1 DNA polymerase III subunit gamma and tau [Saccharopolyspora karakumensis]
MALALYRKYRPATFAEVAGQEHVTEPLRTALSAGRINHAYLFSGPRGCGKTSSARILARSLNCAQGPTADPCGECDSCVSLAPEGGGSVDVVELDAASHGGVDDTRELRDRAFFAPAQSRYRIFIIDEAHMVTTQGFNALLKIVEEPPEHLIFVFATTEPDKVLTTIRSRTHHYPFRLMPPGVMRELVERICADEGVKVEPAVFPLVIRAGGGSARDTLSVLDQLLAGAGDEGVTYERAVALLGVTDVALIDDMVDALAAGDAASVYGTVERLVEAGHDPRRFGSDLLDRLRDLVLLSSVPDAGERGLVETTGDELTRMQQQSEHLGAATLSRFAEIVHTGLSEMRGATAPRLLLELLCARMLLPAVSDSETALLQRLERVERRMTIAPGEAPAAEPGAAAPVSNDGDKPKRVFQRPHERAAAETAQEAPATPKPAETPAVQEKPAPAPAPEPTPQRPAAQAEKPAAAPQPQRPAEPPRPPEPAPEPAQPAASAPAASAPAASAPNGFDAAAVRRVWTDVLQGVAKRNRPTQALLLNATVQDLNDGVLVLSMPTSGLVKQLAQQRRLDFVRESLREVVGGEWDIQCVEAGAAPPARPAAPKQPPQPPQRPSQQQAPAPQQQPAEQRPPEPKPSQGNGQGPHGAAQQRNPGGARGGSVPRPPEPDDIPPPPEPPDEEPPPDDIPPPPEPQRPAVPEPEDEDPESMLAESSPMEAGTRVGRDPDSAAVELFERELGARRIEG